MTCSFGAMLRLLHDLASNGSFSYFQGLTEMAL